MHLEEIRRLHLRFSILEHTATQLPESHTAAFEMQKFARYCRHCLIWLEKASKKLEDKINAPDVPETDETVDDCE